MRKTLAALVCLLAPILSAQAEKMTPALFSQASFPIRVGVFRECETWLANRYEWNFDNLSFSAVAPETVFAALPNGSKGWEAREAAWKKGITDRFGPVVRKAYQVLCDNQPLGTLVEDTFPSLADPHQRYAFGALVEGKGKAIYFGAREIQDSRIINRITANGTVSTTVYDMGSPETGRVAPLSGLASLEIRQGRLHARFLVLPEYLIFTYQNLGSGSFYQWESPIRTFEVDGYSLMERTRSALSQRTNH